MLLKVCSYTEKNVGIQTVDKLRIVLWLIHWRDAGLKYHLAYLDHDIFLIEVITQTDDSFLYRRFVLGTDSFCNDTSFCIRSRLYRSLKPNCRMLIATNATLCIC